jgi:uncharacterized protein YdhG (YjbR/CyaY superfamily)
MKQILPNATEQIKYNMPTFYDGKNLIHFAAFKNHIGIYGGGRLTSVFADKLKEYKTSKGAIQLPNSKPLPVELIKEITIWCGENNIS